MMASRLISFGKIQGGMSSVFDALTEVIGPDGTLIVPAYQLGSEAGDVFDRAASPPLGVGPFPEYFVNLPDTVRSHCPIHNHAAFGRRVDLMNAVDGSVSLGRGSDFEAFENADAKLLLLGCRFSDGATFAHHMEAVCEVPYREWITLRRKVKKDGHVEDQNVRYFARKENEWEESFDVCESWMRAEGVLIEENCWLGKSMSMRMKDLGACLSAQLARDPYALVKKTLE